VNARGFSVLEALVAVGLLLLLLALVAPSLRAASSDAHLVGAAEIFTGEFRKARSMAVRLGVQTALRFEQEEDGMYLSTYVDGNHNGVLAGDIRRGIDRRVSGPTRLAAFTSGVRVAINPDVPAPPPERGTLDPRDPIRFGRGDMVSFSPLGTATPGTLYLAVAGAQAAVRVNGETARVRCLLYRGGAWRER